MASNSPTCLDAIVACLMEEHMATRHKYTEDSSHINMFINDVLSKSRADDGNAVLSPQLDLDPWTTTCPLSPTGSMLPTRPETPQAPRKVRFAPQATVAEVRTEYRTPAYPHRISCGKRHGPGHVAVKTCAMVHNGITFPWDCSSAMPWLGTVADMRDRLAAVLSEHDLAGPKAAEPDNGQAPYHQPVVLLARMTFRLWEAERKLSHARRVMAGFKSGGIERALGEAGGMLRVLKHGHPADVGVMIAPIREAHGEILREADNLWTELWVVKELLGHVEGEYEMLTRLVWDVAGPLEHHPIVRKLRAQWDRVGAVVYCSETVREDIVELVDHAIGPLEECLREEGEAACWDAQRASSVEDLVLEMTEMLTLCKDSQGTLDQYYNAMVKAVEVRSRRQHC